MSKRKYLVWSLIGMMTISSLTGGGFNRPKDRSRPSSSKGRAEGR